MTDEVLSHVETGAKYRVHQSVAGLSPRDERDVSAESGLAICNDSRVVRGLPPRFASRILCSRTGQTFTTARQSPEAFLRRTAHAVMAATGEDLGHCALLGTGEDVETTARIRGEMPSISG